jgi:hypothetical protein
MTLHLRYQVTLALQQLSNLGLQASFSTWIRALPIRRSALVLYALLAEKVLYVRHTMEVLMNHFDPRLRMYSQSESSLDSAPVLALLARAPVLALLARALE